MLIDVFVYKVMGHEKRPSTRQVIKTLIADDGWKGFYRGIGPRFFSMSAWGTSMILAYEYLSMITSFFCAFLFHFEAIISITIIITKT